MKAGEAVSASKLLAVCCLNYFGEGGEEDVPCVSHILDNEKEV